MAGKSGPSKGGNRGKRPGKPLKEGDEGFGRERLQKVLAAAGIASRRDCEELIRDGRVEVDGQAVTEMGVKVDPAKSEIRVDGTPLRKAKLVYYALNKPQGVVCTNYDPSGRPRVIDLLPSDERVFPVGRLDRASEGLILVTNDGAFANRVTHPRFGVDKTYIVRVAGKPDPKSLLQLRKGIWTSEGVCRVQSVHIKGSRGNSTDLIIVLNEGKNREIRRILARVGHKVLLLRRVAVGPVRLGKIEPGTFRRVTSAEIEALLEESRQKRRRGDKADGTRPPRGEAGAGGKPGGPAAGAKGGKPQSADFEDDYDDELVAPERQVREEMLSPGAGLTGVRGDVIDFDDDDEPLASGGMNLSDLPLLDGDDEDDEDDDLQADEGIAAELLDDDFDSEEPGGWPDEDEDEEDDDFGGGAFRESGAAPTKAGRPPRGGRQSGGPPRNPRGAAGRGAGGGRPAGRGKPGGTGRGGYQGERTGGEGQYAETQSAGLGRAKFGKGKRPGGGKPLGGKPGGGKRGAGKPRTGGGTSSHAGGGGQSDYGRRGAGRGKGGGKAGGGKPGGGKMGGKGGRGKGRSGGGRG